MVAGGVAANAHLRAKLGTLANEEEFRFVAPPPRLCTDNAAMVAATAWWRLQSDGESPLDLGADPNLRLPFIES